MAAARRWPTLNLDVSPGVSEGAARRARAAAAGDGVQPPVAGAVRPHRDRRGRAHPGRGTGDPRRQPSLVLRSGGDGDGRRQVGSHGALPRQEGGVRRPDLRLDRQGDGRDPRRSGKRIGSAVGGRGRGARRRRDGGDHAAGHDPARAGLLRTRAQGPVGCGPARPALGCAGDPGRVCGAPRRSGRAAPACRTC